MYRVPFWQVLASVENGFLTFLGPVTFVGLVTFLGLVPTALVLAQLAAAPAPVWVGVPGTGHKKRHHLGR